MPEVFEHLSRFEKGAGGEIQLTDAMARMIGNAPFHGLRFEGERFDCGDKIGFFEANIAFALARNEMRDDVASVLRLHERLTERTAFNMRIAMIGTGYVGLVSEHVFPSSASTSFVSTWMPTKLPGWNVVRSRFSNPGLKRSLPIMLRKLFSFTAA